jgi:tetratricopeptide (TPR) repeat protein
MQIIHKIDDFLFLIFPNIKRTDTDQIIKSFEEYYTFGLYKPKVSVDKDWITIEIDGQAIISQEADYRKTIALCEKGRYSEAKPILTKLIEKNPTISEYHRIMGQILSDEGDQEEAINCLIDALRWDSKNGWALLMMGNILAKFQNDIPTAMKYYDQAVAANTTDHISLTNIGYLLQKQGKLDDAKKYFLEAIKINNQYPNTHFALGMIAQLENDLDSAFYSTIQAIKLNINKDVLYQNSVRQAFEIANKVLSNNDGKKIFRTYRSKLEFDGDREIDIVEDAEIDTAAKFEFAENYNRPKHIVRYKPNYPAVEHLIMHELVHLDFVIEARKEELNQLFTSTQEHKTEFIKRLEPTVKKFRKMGISEQSITSYCSGLFEGMNRQIFNTPIDLFIEDFLYINYSELRPYQFISLYTLLQEGLKAVTDKKIVELSPEDILSKSKVYNLVNAIQFKELFGLDYINDFQATPSELMSANTFYDEYLQYKDDREPAEEYELLIHWAEDLKLDKYFELVDEKGYRKRSDVDKLLDSIEKDPHDLETKDPTKEREMEKFQKANKSSDTNMAVVMFMVEALQYFDALPEDKIKEIAIEIAMQGTHGYNPKKKNYRISSIPDKTFSGYHILAYYYVSWMLAMPQEVDKLEMDFDKEYKLAISMHKTE